MQHQLTKSNDNTDEQGIIIHKITLQVAVATAIVGLFLFLPFEAINWLSYSFVLKTHVLLGIILSILIVRLFFSHIPIELFNPFKQGFKKWNGFKLVFYFFLTILSGIILIFFSLRWLVYFHVFIGFWSFVVSWKHMK